MSRCSSRIRSSVSVGAPSASIYPIAPPNHNSFAAPPSPAAPIATFAVRLFTPAAFQLHNFTPAASPRCRSAASLPQHSCHTPATPSRTPHPRCSIAAPLHRRRAAAAPSTVTLSASPHGCTAAPLGHTAAPLHPIEHATSTLLRRGRGQRARGEQSAPLTTRAVANCTTDQAITITTRSRRRFLLDTVRWRVGRGPGAPRSSAGGGRTEQRASTWCACPPTRKLRCRAEGDGRCREQGLQAAEGEARLGGRLLGPEPAWVQTMRAAWALSQGGHCRGCAVFMPKAEDHNDFNDVSLPSLTALRC